MLWPVKFFRGQQPQIEFLLGIDNDIPKVILNLQWLLPLKVMRICHLSEKLQIL